MSTTARSRPSHAWIALLAAMGWPAAAQSPMPSATLAPIKLEQIISREDPTFSCAIAGLTVGRDGMVYLTSAGHDAGYILRVSRDGKDKLGAASLPAIHNATANRDGVVAGSHAHFSHQVMLYSRDLQKREAAADFLVSDQLGWDAPASVEAGASGDFFGLDQHRDRILRISPEGKVVKSYSLPHAEKSAGQCFRVCEKAQGFYVNFSGRAGVQCVGFDGQLRWESKLGVSASSPWGDGGGFDVDDDGMLYAIGANESVLRRIGADGRAAGQVQLKIPARQGPRCPIRGLRVWAGEAIVRFHHPSELFQVYDLATGEFRRAVSIAHERLTVTMPDGPWTAGGTVDFAVEFDAGGERIRPAFQVWARPFGVLDYRPLLLAGGKLHVPADFAGLYQIKVTPEANPWQQSAATSEYRVTRLVEIRRPGAVGCVAVATRANRVWFARGEEIPLSVIARIPTAAKERELTIRLADGEQVLASTKARLPGDAKPLPLVLPAGLTARLRPGRYVLQADADGVTCVSQPLVIGPGLGATPFLTLQYGDYGPTYPQASAWDAPDIVAAVVVRNRRLGFNLMVDRLGHPLQMDAVAGRAQRAEMDGASKSLAADPLGTPAEKLQLAPALLQTLAGYGATGAHQMAILMGNDAGLPVGGPGFDGRKLEQVLTDLATVTETLRDYPAFRGWSWSSNWWVFGNRRSAAARTAEEKAAYEAALKRAGQTGAWDDVLGHVADTRLAYAVDAQASFNRKLQDLAPGRTTAVACPFRNVESYPPISLSNVDETDLQAQWEQVALPYHGPFGVDFYRRPGRRAWGHPEVWNDAGTGDQILATLWQMVMRGADGVGCSGLVPQWYSALNGNTDDPRLGWNGMTSVYRSLNGVLRRYGPWLASMHNHDRVAIVASGRMYKIDNWTNVMGRHFARVMEAYVCCLHVHRPAAIVFAEDLKPDTLKPYQAVLVVGQTVEMEPALAAALKAARQSGTLVLADGTCRPELVKDYLPLGIAFDQFEKDPSPAADDHAYWRLAAAAKANLPALSKALAGVRPPAVVSNPEVFLSERRAEKGRCVILVNNTLPSELEPGHLWRVSLAVASLVPQVVPVKLDLAPGEAVYDVFAGKAVQAGADGTVSADCRNSPARVFAILPAALGQVELEGPKSVAPGETMRWKARVLDRTGKPMEAAVPVRIRLVAGDGATLEEEHRSASSSGQSGEFLLPLNLPRGPLVLEATELLSGRGATLEIGVSAGRAAQVDLAAGAATLPAATRPADHTASASAVVRDFAPADDSFGPHVRDVVITGGGKLAVMNTMNWDHNLYAVDIDSGQIRWRQRAGNYFAFEPAAVGDGMAVQGFDLRSAQGYHLYLVGADGGVRRRFALYGLPQRLPHRFVPALVRDHINSFAVGDGGRWIATAGDLGLAVWSGDGRVLWQQDWYKTGRHTAKLLALDASTLLAIEGMTATAYRALDGARKWQLALGRAGEIRTIRTSVDGKTCGLFNTADGGKLLVLRDGKILRSLPTPAEDLGFSADGALVAVVTQNVLKLYSVSDGLQWIFHGDDLLHFPRFSSDGRLAVCSSLGTVYFGEHLAGPGAPKFSTQDHGALAVPAWLADGGLLLATWHGAVCRLDKEYSVRWRTRLAPDTADMRGRLLADDGTPTSAITAWGNAADRPADASANLLTAVKPLVSLAMTSGTAPMTETPQQKVATLFDGQADPPAEPWIPWHYVGTFAETSPVNYLLLDAYRTQMKVTGVTLIEDPAHPESWLRDAAIESWDAARETWTPIQPLLSNAAVHTHWFARPVEAARFRILLPWGVCGNVRLAEIALHGELLGCSHPDAAANCPRAVLFDEQEDVHADLTYPGNGLSMALEGAYSGGRCLVVTPPEGTQATAGATWRQQFGHTIRNWDFPIAEHPRPGEYRYLQFAWRGDAKTTGLGISVVAAGAGHVAFTAGLVTPPELTTARKVADVVPREWTLVRVDLWEVFQRPARVQSMVLMARGGAGRFDRVILGRTEADLPTRAPPCPANR